MKRPLISVPTEKLESTSLTDMSFMKHNRPDSSRRDRRREPLSPQVRAEALEILRSKKGTRRFKQVEKLLGWDSSVCMPFTEMAKALGLTSGEFRYLIERDYLLSQQKRRRAATKEASKFPLVLQRCRELRFSIELPRAWRTDYIPAPYPPEKQFIFAEHFLARQFMEGMRERWENEDPLFEPLIAERRTRLLNMRVGIFRAWPKNRKDHAALTVTRLHLTEPLSALEIYQCDKPYWRGVAWANRAPRGIEIDGVQAICYQYGSGATAGLGIYFAQGTDAWIFSCLCNEGVARETFIQYRPLFQRIACSLRRIRVV